MEKEEIIIHLIAQDMKHNILTVGLENIGLSGTERFDLDIVSVVARLMCVENPSDEWLEVYNNYLVRAGGLKPDFKVKGLNELAKECYNFLISVNGG